MAVAVAGLPREFQGKPLFKLVEHQMNRQASERLQASLAEAKSALPPEILPDLDRFLTRWSAGIPDAEFWQQDAALVYNQAVSEGAALLAARGLPDDDETLAALFNVLVLYLARQRPVFREILGGKRRYPTWSAAWLWLPLYNMHARNAMGGLTGLEIAGVGAVSISHLLLFAGLGTGTFLVFGLKSRKAVFIAAAFFYLLGVAMGGLDP